MADQDFTNERFTKENLFGLFEQYKNDIYTLARKAIDLGLHIEIEAYDCGMVKLTTRNLKDKPGWSKSITVWPDSQTYQETIYEKED